MDAHYLNLFCDPEMHEAHPKCQRNARGASIYLFPSPVPFTLT
jgi:hypothetical protein